MTTLYHNPRHHYLIVHSTVDQPILHRWKHLMEQCIENEEKKEKGYWTQLQQFIDTYFDSSFAEPYTLYHTLLFLNADLLSMFPHDKKPVGKCLISYRRYQLTDEKPSTEKSFPFSLSRCIPGDDCYPHDAYRLRYVFDQNPDRRYREYTAFFCIQRDEGIQGGTLLFYPQYDEESSVVATFSQLLTQCSLPRKELEIPFSPGSMVLMSGTTWHTMEPLRGKGTCLLMLIDFCCEA